MAVKDLLIKVGVLNAKDAEKKLKGVDGALDKLGSVALKVSGVFFAAKGLIAGFSGVIEASARQEQAEKALQVALGRTSQSLLNQASALQEVTTAGDEAIIEQQAFLASLKFTEDQIKTIIPVALDLSAATGISLESAVRNTSKTFSGLAGELGELVPQLRDLTQEEMKAGKAVEVLGELFEGQASKQAETLSGSLEQMINAIGDSAEAIGSLLSPVVITVAKGIKTLAESVSTVTKRFKNFGKEVDAVFLDKTQLAEQSIDNFKESIKGLSEQELLALGRSIESSGTGLVRYSEESDLSNRKLEILNETIEKNREHFDKMNSVIGEGLEIRTQESEILSNVDERFLNFVESQRKLLMNQEEEQKNIARLNLLYPELAENLGLVKKTEEELQKEKEKRIQQDIRSAIISGQSATQAMQSVVKAELMEAISGLMSSIMKTVPFPFNLAVAAGAGALATDTLNKALASASKLKFAEGGIVPGIGSQDTVPAMLTPGEVILNQAQQENLASNMGVTVNISGGVVDESYVNNELIPALNKATSLGATLNA